MADGMSIDKKEPEREGSDDSMGSTPEAEQEAPQDNIGQPKRKGGRKPVRWIRFVPRVMDVLLIYTSLRSMLPPRNESSVTGRPRQRSESAGLSTLSSSRKPSESMRPIFTTCRRPTVVPLTSVSC